MRKAPFRALSLRVRRRGLGQALEKVLVRTFLRSALLGLPRLLTGPQPSPSRLSLLPKSKRPEHAPVFYFLCAGEDSNLHALNGRYHLKVVRLPISPPAHHCSAIIRIGCININRLKTKAPFREPLVFFDFIPAQLLPPLLQLVKQLQSGSGPLRDQSPLELHSC
jgi:hypothetical protein